MFSAYTMHDTCVYRYQATFALMANVWCLRVAPSSRAQCTKNVHPLVLSVFFFYVLFSRTADRMQNPESARNKKKKKSALRVKCALPFFGVQSYKNKDRCIERISYVG